MWSKDFWLALLERMIATAAATLLGVLTADGFDFADTDWSAVGVAVAVATAVSLLKGVLANAATRTGPSAGNAEIIPRHAAVE